MRAQLTVHRIARCVRRARASVERVVLALGVRLHMKSSLRAAAEVHRLAALAAAWPTDTRRVFTLHAVYDFTIPEIAAHLGLSERAVEHHLITAAHCVGASGCVDAPVAPEHFAARPHPDATAAVPRIDSSESAVNDADTRGPGAAVRSGDPEPP